MRGAPLLTALVMAGGALSQTGCAAVFRESQATVHVESDPPGGTLSMKDHRAPTPADVPVPRGGLTEIRVIMPGFEEHHGTVRKKVNGLWLTADLATCIVPIMLCIPLFADAISGAWVDVEPHYRAHLVPLGLATATAYGPNGAMYVPRPQPSAKPAPATVAPPPPPPPTATISESERKAAARAAFQEGMELQAQKNYPEALARFQAAQRIYDAPTHLLHIAQCLVVAGKLVEAQESYETLTHRELQGNAPEPFRDAVETGKRELAELQPRIPTLRINVQPAPSTLRNLALTLNGRPLPAEVIGIARPVNPGKYRVTATAWGLPPSKPVDITLNEADALSVDVKLGR